MTPSAAPAVGVHTAFLRVYEPLAAFDGAARRRWEAYVASGAALAPAEGVVRERAAALRAVASSPPQALPAVEEHAFVTEVDGVTLLCPWRTRLRALEALDEFAADLPDEVVRAFLPLEAVRAAGAELERERTVRPGERVAQLTSPWHVPLRWFVLVDAEERQVRLGSSRGGGTSVDRLAGRGLVHLLDDTALAEDESAGYVAAALAALGAGDMGAAGEAYARVTARMKALQAVESAN